MRCPTCQDEDSRVIDSRTAGDAIRRRRQCANCGERFTTHERVERRIPWILKKDGKREPFAREKVLRGIALACRKRPIDAAEMERIVERVEAELADSRLPEVPASAVGEAVMRALAMVDAVAYTRFASVYREFESVEQFVDAIQELPR